MSPPSNIPHSACRSTLILVKELRVLAIVNSYAFKVYVILTLFVYFFKFVYLSFLIRRPCNNVMVPVAVGE